MKFNKFVAKHKVLALILINGVEYLFLAFMYYLQFLGLTGVIVWAIILFIVNFLSAWVVESVLLEGPLKVLDNYCDPDDFYNMTKELLSYKLKGRKRLVILMDYSTALSAKGEYEEACSILESIDSAKLSQGAAHILMIYNYNLACMYMNLERYEEARPLFEVTEQFYNCLKEGKFKSSWAIIAENAKLFNHYCKGEYAETLRYEQDVENAPLRQKVSRSFTFAKAYLALGENEKAREKLNFVLVNGNRLHIVKLAKQLLDNMQNNVN